MKHWPDRLCEGRIVYEPGSYGNFVLRDAEHGIPIMGHLRGAQVTVCNYPKQTEDIARRLAAAWNAAVGVSTEELERRATETNN